MPELQPVVTFTGIAGIESCRFLLTRGTQPSRAIITTPIIDQATPEIGTLEITYGATVLTLTDCSPAESSVQGDGSGQTLTITLEDRRWRWSLFEIVGRYNVRYSTNVTGVDNVRFRKTPQELASMLFDKMGEVGYDVSELPNDSTPYVDWTNTRCDLALSQLCQELGCDVAPDLSTGTFRIVKIGTGSALPVDLTAEYSGGSFAYPATPDRLQAATAPVRYECVLELENVGREKDGDDLSAYKPIADLSYKPAAGWIDALGDGDFEDVEGDYTDESTGAVLKNRDLAAAHVGRTYRIKSIVGGGGAKHLNPPGYDETGAPDVESIRQLLPLVAELNDTYYDSEDQAEYYKEARVFGQWDAELFGIEEDEDPVTDVNGNTLAGTMVKPGEYSIDVNRGLVKFSSQIVFTNDDGDPEPAHLYLQCVVQPDWPTLNKKVYYAKFRDRPGVVDPSTTRTIVRSDVELKYRAKYNASAEPPTLSSVTKNLTAVNQELDYYLDAFQDEFTPKPGQTASYAGLLLISPDGAIEQVEFVVDGQGMTTRAARFTQLAPYLPGYQQLQANNRDRLWAAEFERVLRTNAKEQNA